MNRTLLVTAAFAALLLALPAAAPAPVGPTNCPPQLTIKGKRYQVTAKHLKCRTAREHVKRYFKTGRKPGGYTCKNPPSVKGRVDFWCWDGPKTFNAIRR